MMPTDCTIFSLPSEVIVTHNAESHIENYASILITSFIEIGHLIPLSIETDG
jgi:hypothetical protein